MSDEDSVEITSANAREVWDSASRTLAKSVFKRLMEMYEAATTEEERQATYDKADAAFVRMVLGLHEDAPIPGGMTAEKSAHLADPKLYGMACRRQLEELATDNPLIFVLAFMRFMEMGEDILIVAENYAEVRRSQANSVSVTTEIAKTYAATVAPQHLTPQ